MAVGIVDGVRRALRRSVYAAPAAMALFVLAYAASGAAGRATLLLLVDACAVVAVLVGVARYRPARPLPWYCLAAVQTFVLLGDVTLYGPVVTGVSWPWMDVTTVLYTLPYLFGCVAAVLWARRTKHAVPGRWWVDVTLIDVAVILVAGGLLSWVFLVSPMMTGTTNVPTMLLNSVSPVGDLVLLAIGFRIAFGEGQRSPALGLLGAGVVLWLCGDTARLVLVAQQHQLMMLSWLEPFWGAAAIVFASAALDPTMVTVGRPAADGHRFGSGRRLVLLGTASLLPPAAQLVQYLRAGDLHVPLVSASCALLFVLVMIRMSMLLGEQRRIAITDTLTGLRTRRFFEEHLAIEHERASRFGTAIGVLLVDIDHFKTVNDRYGHKAGDTVLREVANRLRNCARAGDVVARYGGEEFALIVAPTDRAGAARLGERLRDAVGGTSFRLDDRTELLVTASIGVALLPDHAAVPDELTVRADQCLYRAKNAGRNRVVVAGELHAQR